MDLKKLFSVQKVLRDRINYNEPDRFDKLVLALLVEIGECANEYRAWKFWSKDQEPRTSKKKECHWCNGTGDENHEYIMEDAEGNGGHEYVNCENCEGTGYKGETNPLLEEFVDIAHFILELGIEIGEDTTDLVIFDKEKYKKKTVHEQFLDIYKRVIDIQESGGEESRHYYWIGLLLSFIALGELLGFEWEEIEDAYMSKNKINHDRQTNGY